MPATADGAYYNGYDYRAIGQLADKVILMAHDYQPSSLAGFVGTTYYKNAALTPLPVGLLLPPGRHRPATGVQDVSKLALAISCSANAWQTDSAGKLTSDKPILPTMATVTARLKAGAAIGWSEIYRNPYATYETESGQHVFLWYEDSRSVGGEGPAGQALWGHLGLPVAAGEPAQRQHRRALPEPPPRLLLSPRATAEGHLAFGGCFLSNFFQTPS